MLIYKNTGSPLNRAEDKNMLVVDDLIQVSDIVRMMLRNNGYKHLIVAGSGHQALRSVAVKTVDLAIIDWDMPNMNGIELLTQIKNDPKLFSIPVIIMSEERTDSKVFYAFEEGADGYLIKPFNENDLINNVKKALGQGIAKGEMGMKILEMRRLKLSKNYREAIDLGVEILSKGHNQRVAMMICDCLYQIEQYDEAISWIAAMEDGDKSSEHLNLLGKIHMNLGQYDKGIFALEQAVKINPLNNYRKIDLAEAYIEAGRREEAEKIMQSVTDIAPTDLSLIKVAQIYLDLDEIDKAGQLLNQTVYPIKSQVHVFNNYAVALRKIERFEDATDIYLKCLKIDPDSDVLHYNLAVLYIKSRKMEEAKQALDKALKLNPDNKLARDLLPKCQG